MVDGVGKFFRIHNRPMIIRAAGFYNVERPTNAAKWEISIGFNFVLKKLLWNSPFTRSTGFGKLHSRKG